MLIKISCKWLLIGWALALGGCVTTGYDQEDHSLAGKIYHTERKQFIPELTYFGVLRNADFVLLGETHDNPLHHQWQAKSLTEALKDQEGPRMVVFEHLHSGQLGALKAFQSLPQRNPALLGDLLSWQSSGWPPYEIFEPVFAATLNSGATILPGNFPPAAIRQVYQEGMTVVLPEQTIARYKLNELPESATNKLNQLIVDSHCGMIGAEQAVPMSQIQKSRDAHMALQMATSRGTGKTVLIAGQGHVRRDFGVPQYLAKLQPTSTVVSVGMVEVREGFEDPSGYSEVEYYDVIVFTPIWEREDQCEKMRAKMNHKSK